MQIGAVDIGPPHPCFVIAEVGVNHNGNIELAHRLIDRAVQAGANAVKFQTFTPEDLTTGKAARAAYQLDDGEGHEDQLSMLRGLALAPDAYTELKRHCEASRVVFLSSPFDEKGVKILDGLNVHAFKVPSGELTNLPFLKRIAACGRPVILSTGMATLQEVEDALSAIDNAGAPPVTILHATSAYPAAPEDINLRAMKTLSQAFDRPVGLSDHSAGTAIPIAAVALGACIIEKHFTLDCNMPGPDHRASLEPEGFLAMVEGIRQIEAALGDGVKVPAESEREIALVVRKSLVAAHDLAVGVVLSEDMLKAKRPGHGIPPSELQAVLGRRLRTNVASDELLEWAHLE
jgi:N,N'-diacetyllegionaminate synthase